MDRAMPRCDWCDSSQASRKYHDEEWGVPVKDDRTQFEALCMEVMMAGLSWDIVLQKREILRQAFADFDPIQVAEFDDNDVARILEIPGMIRSERKIRAMIKNAQVFLKIAEEWGSFSNYLWSFSDGNILVYRCHVDEPVKKNAFANRIVDDLKKRGMTQIGPVTMYSHLQAVGIINDHHPSCHRYYEVTRNHPVRYLLEGK